ncbi:MAG: NAD(P)H-dependent oxidoreductase [Actinomycetota bacterium]|nr:MAG: NAD(P)H-dependent oxidoreductase [Actinomycetota bacterium]
MSNVKILALSGSSRRGSYNTALLQNAQQLAPKNMSIEIYKGLDRLPFYSEDLDGTNLHPEARRLRAEIASADGVLIATPEYNYSLTAILKNALDWASRPSGKHAFVNKPTAIMGASASILGTVRAQLHTRDVLHALQADVLSRPEVLLTQAGSKFDQHGHLTDETATVFLKQLLEGLETKIESQRILTQILRKAVS